MELQPLGASNTLLEKPTPLTNADLLAAQQVERQAATDKVIASESRRRVVVAGPGTGKTTLFQKAFEAVHDQGLALTFINALENDLRLKLPPTVDVSTFHGFCKGLLHRSRGSDFAMYMPLLDLIASDLAATGVKTTGEKIARAFHNLDESSGLIAETIRRADYYGAVSHDDVVYRTSKLLESKPERIPTFPLVVIDEFQDFNPLEIAFIKLIESKSPVLIAGDDDQALYSFKSADAKYLRSLANDGSYAKFELPFCSRCTEVMVAAVKDVIREAQNRKLLVGRIDKPFRCYLPDKQEDSKKHPFIIHAECSVHTPRAPLVGRYVVDEIGQIPPEDVKESHEEGYPTVLVVGPKPFPKAVFEEVRKTYPDAELKVSDSPEIDLLDGYKLLAQRRDSRLGWRILLELDPCPQARKLIEDSYQQSKELLDLLPNDYVEGHLVFAGLIRQIQSERDLAQDERAALEKKLDGSFDQVVRNVQNKAEEPKKTDRSIPSIVCTTLVGGKGLSAGYVFVAGFSDGAFPQDPNRISDSDVCKLVVALSRGRKECHLISCGGYAGRLWYKRPSCFIDWIHQPIKTVTRGTPHWKKQGKWQPKS